MLDKIDIGDRSLSIAWWVLLGVVLAAVMVARIHLLDVPLERDEGEYAYAGQLMLQAIPPYKLAYTMKLPGTHAAYAAIMWLFGQTIAGIHIGLLLINFATVVIVFVLGRRLINNTCGIAAAASYAVLSVSLYVFGFAGHATHFILLPALAGACLLTRPLNQRSATAVFAAGLLFGAALLMKQSAIFFVAFGGIYLLLRDRQDQLIWRRILVRALAFCFAAILPLAITCGLLWKAGVFGTFWFWAVKYAREYATILSISDGLKILRESLPDVIRSGWPLWLLAPLGLALSVWNRRTRFAALSFFCPFAFFSMLSVCPGFHFRPHYFIQLLPAISLLAGAAVAIASASKPKLVRWIALLAFAAATGFSLWQEREFLFRISPAAAARHAYGLNPFAEAIPVAEFLRQRSNPGDTVAVLGSEPEIYFYSHRHSATGYIYTYGLMEPQRYAADMQRAMIREIEAARPRFFVLVAFGYSWLKRTGSDTTIFDWFDRYAAANLTGIGVVNVVSPRQTDYYLPYNGEPMQLAPNYILIYERKL